MKLLLLFLLALGSGLWVPASAATQPNIVFVITDDQGYGDLACHGNPVIKTPHLDTLYKESAVLEDYHVAPTCSPTRAALLTGHWTNRTGVWHTINGRSMLRENEVTLGQLLKDNGYETGMFGKWHLGDNYPYRPEDRGFTEVYRHGGGGVGQTPDVWDNTYFDDRYFHNGKIVQAEGFCTDAFFKAGNAFIRKCAAAKKPFLAYISTNAPHGPLHCPQKYMDLYPDQPKNTQAFLGMISNIDENVGKTRALLKELGIADNTIFIFTTDNGTAGGAKIFNAGMRGQKGSEYEGGHRVPFFISWPGGPITVGEKIDELTHAVDVVPTVLDLTGSKAPEGLKFDGRSMRNLLDAKLKYDWPDRMLVTDSQRVVDPIKWRKSAVMYYSWRLVNGTELYKVSTDPGQKKDVAAENPEIVKKMRAFYEDWWAELEPTFAQTTEIYLGQPGQEKVTLTSHDWITTQGGSVPWNQGQIRRAAANRQKQAVQQKHTAHWAVKVVTAGTYEISLLRWPEEAAHPITAPLPAGDTVPGSSSPFRATPGKAIPATKASLRLNGKELAAKRVGKEDVMVTFTAELPAGSHQLSPVFLTAEGGEVGAFYALVTKK